MTRGTIAVAGALAQKPRHGGHAWVLLQYLLGFKRLGWDVLFVDQLGGTTGEQSGNVETFISVTRDFGLMDQSALLLGSTGETVGLSRAAIAARLRSSAFLLNVMGFLTDDELLGCAARRVFLDIDPGFPQMWRALDLHDAFAGHDTFVTIGANIGRDDCAIPTCGLEWITTPQPVVLDQWPVTATTGEAHLTSVATWRGAYGPVEYAGRTYGPRAHEFRAFAALPIECGLPFTLALDIHPTETADLALLRNGGWCLVDPAMVAGDPWAYRSFIHRSAGEFMVAKHMYVATNSGWFSDRSICYLASGKPVLAQDTGFSQNYSRGRGLLRFRVLEEARDAAHAIMADYAAHARAARRVAETCFDSDIVLTRLLANLGIG